MSKIIFNDGTEIEDYKTTYVVAEVNSSHNGDIEVAKRMIDAAKDAGCDCVKFQSWTTDTLYSKTYYDQNPIAKRFVDKLSLSADELADVSQYCKMKKIGFSSTPYSKEEVDFLVEQDVPFIKISSMEINNLEYLEYIGSKGIPIVLSTGMADEKEIERAVKIIHDTGNDNLALLHCVSIYPADVKTINLNNIIGLRKKYPECAIGFSDHTLGEAAAIAATALGASIIEKHLTLDSKKIGMDNQMAMEPDQLKSLVQNCRNVRLALGSEQRTVLPEEYEQRKKMRRSIVAARDLRIGETIQHSDLIAKRPGDGISPDMIQSLIGYVVTSEIKKDTVVGYDSIKKPNNAI